MLRRTNSRLWLMLVSCMIGSMLIARLIPGWSALIIEQFDLTREPAAMDVLEINKGEVFYIDPRNESDDNTRALAYFWESYLPDLVNWMTKTAENTLREHRQELSGADVLLIVVSWGTSDPESAVEGHLDVSLLTAQDLAASEDNRLNAAQVEHHYKFPARIPQQSSRLKAFDIIRTDLALTFENNRPLSTFQDVIFSPEWYRNRELRSIIRPYWHIEDLENEEVILHLSDEQYSTSEGSSTPVMEAHLRFSGLEELGADSTRTRAHLNAYGSLLDEYIRSLRSIEDGVRIGLCDLETVKRMILEIASNEGRDWARLWSVDEAKPCSLAIPPPYMGPYLP